MTYNYIRSNIRNAYIAEDTDTLLDAWNQMVAAGRREEAGYIRELLNESLDEIEETAT